MKIKRIIALLIASIVFNSVLIAQENQTQTNGKPIIQVFGDFYANFGEDKEELGFELNRSYLGYQYELKKGLSIKAVMNIGESKQVNDYPSPPERHLRWFPHLFRYQRKQMHSPPVSQ